MNTSKQFIINTFDKNTYAKISADLPENQLHIIDDNNIHRTVIPSYDLTIEKINEISSKYISIEELKNALSDINDDVNDIEVGEIGQALLNIKNLINKNLVNS